MTEMNPAMTDLVLEHLRAIRTDIRSTHERLDTLTLRVSSLEHNVASLHGDMAAMRESMQKMNAERNEALKAELTDEQKKKFDENVAAMPQGRRGGI